LWIGDDHVALIAVAFTQFWRLDEFEAIPFCRSSRCFPEMVMGDYVSHGKDFFIFAATSSLGVIF